MKDQFKRINQWLILKKTLLIVLNPLLKLPKNIICMYITETSFLP